MILPLAVVTHLSTACAPEVAPAMLADIARVESRLDPFAIHDNATGRSYWPRDKAEAIRIAVPLLAAGHSIDAGLMGINAGNWRWLGLDAETVFDPCRNIRAGATVLTALSRYNTGSPTRGFRNGYVASVVAAGRALPPIFVTRAAPVAPAPPPSPDRVRVRLWRAYTRSAAQDPYSWAAFSSSSQGRSSDAF